MSSIMKRLLTRRLARQGQDAAKAKARAEAEAIAKEHDKELDWERRSTLVIRRPSTATEPSQSKFPPLPLRPEAKSQVRGRTSDATDTAGGRRRSKSAANKSGVGPEPSLSWGDIFANANTYLRPLGCLPGHYDGHR